MKQPTLKEIADEVRSWPSWLRTSSSVSNAAKIREARKEKNA